MNTKPLVNVYLTAGIITSYLGLTDPVTATTFIYFNSEPGDYVGGGITQKLTPIDGLITAFHSSGNSVNINFSGDDWWSLDFAAPQGSLLIPGTYEGATRFPFRDPTEPGIEVSGAGRGCNELTGKFNVLNAIYGADGNIERFDADFEQHCEGGEATLFGQVRFNKADSQASPEEIRQNIQLEPDELNRLLAFSNKIEDYSTAVYLFSEPGDYIGAGLEQILTPENYSFNVSGNNNDGVHFSLYGDTFWNLNFTSPVALPLNPGGYGKATRYPFNSPTKPGLDVTGDGRGCNTSTGIFLVLDAAYGSDGSVERFDTIFEQHCEGGEPALYGRIRYNAETKSIPEASSPLSILIFSLSGIALSFKTSLKKIRDSYQNWKV